MAKRPAEEELASPDDAHKKFSAVSTEAACSHEVAYPEGYEHGQVASEKPAAQPAKEYPFKLDPFQREAIRALEAGESVMVSAHTSAGKTVVAEYAIAMAMRDQQRVIYTSPIKALSNQKYRELAEEFSDVGLMTGDVTISPDASCLVMTTEILRSMQYKGSEIMREVAWIIFDEVHYMRDRERGVVWEEGIVMAPKNVRFVFLSATVPNAREFAEWVAKIHQQPCHIVYTDFRPTPLQHYIFPAGGDGLYLVVDEAGSFREDSFQKAVNAVTVTENNDKNAKWQKKKNGEEDSESSDIFKIVKMIMAKQFDPVIVFSFSKRECEHLAMQMAKLDFNNEDEKKLIDRIFWSAMHSLSDDDKKLPQVSLILPSLKRGVGVHHSGLLPILKEVIEILFQEGLIKCLFATETFSIGLNMPAKTVVFTNVRKFDGSKFRWITSGEYIQMSGRAGRRGLDSFGVCIMMLDEKLEPPIAKLIVKGAADPLNSAFHLSYNMILNQMRCEETNPEELLRQSFHQFQTDRNLPSLQNRVKALEEEKDAIHIEDENKLREYYGLLGQLRRLRADIREIVFAPRFSLPFLQPGRLVRILRSSETNKEAMLLKEEPSVWGVIINFEQVKSKDDDEATPNDQPKPKYVVDILVNSVKEKYGAATIARPVSLNEDGDPLVTTFPLSQIESMSAVRVRIPKDLRQAEFREHTLRTVLEVMKRFPDGPQLLDPEDDMKVESSSYKKLVRRLEALEALVAEHPLSKSATLDERLVILQKKEELEESIKLARKEVRAASTMVFKDELKARRRVLRRLKYATKEDLVELKGRVACEITSGDELLLTELIFSGVLKDATPEQVAALLSCFVWQEKTKGSSLTEELSLLYSQLQDTAKRVGKVQFESKVPIDLEDYVKSFRPDIMEAVHAWCTGKSFREVIELAQVFEGSLIRAIRRLEELLQQLVSASRSIGEAELEATFQGAITMMKRDIVFAASLYL